MTDMRGTLLALLLFIGFGPVALGQDLNSLTISVRKHENPELGGGWRSDLRRPTTVGKCLVTSTEVEAQKPVPVGEGDVFVRRVYDSDSYFRSLDVSATGSVKGDDENSGSLNLGFVSTYNSLIKSGSLSISGTMRKERLTLSPGHPKAGKDTSWLYMTDAAKALFEAAQTDPKAKDDFIRTCGDYYISQIDLGGAVDVLLTINESEITGDTTRNLSVNGKYSIYEFQTALKQNVKTTSIKKNLIQRVRIRGDAKLQAVPTGDTTIDGLANYLVVDTTTPAKIEYQVTPYETLMLGASVPKPQYVQDAAHMRAVVAQMQDIVDLCRSIDQKRGEFVFDESNDKVCIELTREAGKIVLVVATKLAACVTVLANCKFPDGEIPRHDYAMRARLPVPVELFNEQQQVNILTGQLAAQQTTTNATPPDMWVETSRSPMSADAPSGGNTKVANPDYAAEVKKLMAIDTQRNDAIKAVVEKYGLRRFEAWIKRINSERCAEGHKSACLTDTELASIRATIPDKRGPPR